MVKVFLVEDEIVMREGIKNNIKWEQEGFEFVGEASDGELAYPLIQKTRPDILITDIKMPFMDGLELSRLVKQEMPDMKIIILSGYDEFEYAKEAISIGGLSGKTDCRSTASGSGEKGRKDSAGGAAAEDVLNDL